MKIAVIGAGLMGRAAAWLLKREGLEVTLIDRDADTLETATALAEGVEAHVVSVEDDESLRPLLEEVDAAVSCVPYFFNEALTRLCIETATHMVDLGGNNDVVDAQFDLSDRAREAGVTIIPDCGLAPGMIGIWAMEGANELEECDRISMYCGGLPKNPSPPLNYMQLFSINGLINEYVEPCRILEDGELVEVPGMSGLELVKFDPPYGELEAFYTSGGTSTLVNTLRGRVGLLEYKTLRYPGHIAFFRTLQELGFLDSVSVQVEGADLSPRRFTQNLLGRALPDTGPDVTLLRVDCEGTLEQKPAMIRFEIIDMADEINGISSMMRCTAYPAAIIARMLAEERIKVSGTQPQELVVPPEELRQELKRHGIIVEKLHSDDYEEE